MVKPAFYAIGRPFALETGMLDYSQLDALLAVVQRETYEGAARKLSVIVS